ncbi:MAG: ATP-binding protein [Flavobacteriaceae bacterium]|nr:ATP-binding protein [Flavobacteriaceae bacterium]
MAIFLRKSKSFQSQVFLSFFALISIIVIWLLAYYSFEKRQLRLVDLVQNIESTKSSFSNNTNDLQRFLLYGYKKQSLYKQNKQEDIDTYITKLTMLPIHTSNIQFELKAQNIEFGAYFQQLNSDLNSLVLQTKALKEIIKKIGYKDFGTVGDMRNRAHQIEKEQTIPRVELFLLRRHEKDFMLRSDVAYAAKFNNLIEQQLQRFQSKPRTVFLLQEYRHFFNKVVQLQNIAGIKNTTGIYGHIIHLQSRIKKGLDRIEQQGLDHVQTKTDQLNRQWRLLTIIIVGIIISSVLWFTNKLTSDLKRLTGIINTYIQSQFDPQKNEVIESNILEVDYLHRAFQMLKSQLRSNLDDLERTIEKLEKTAQYKSRFLANMSHEIRTPLNGVLGMLDMLKESKLNKTQRKQLELASFTSKHLLQLVNMVLDYSKIDAGKIKLEQIPMHLHRDLQKLVTIFHYQAKEKKLELEFDFQEDQSCCLEGDPVRLQQVIINLLSNAIKFTHKGKVVLRVHQKELSSDKKQVFIEVEDSGVGIAEKHLDKIFEAFEQGDLSNTREYGGAGLGLTISHQIVDAMGGQLKLETAVGQGTKFSFSIVLPCLPLEERDDRTRHQAPLAAGLQGKKVLVAEDNQLNRRVLKFILDGLQVQSTFAKNGLEAVCHFRNHQYDMVLMDVHMPIMDGYQATKSIRTSKKYKHHDIPVIAVSASAFSEDVDKAKEVGMCDFVSKPIDKNYLQQVMLRYI